MSVTRSRWLLNSGMNLLGGASAALVSFCLPPILARHLPALEYSLWNLVLPIVAYLGLFGSGIHLATAKFISQEHHDEGISGRNRTVRAGFALALAGALIALIAVAGVALFYPKFYPDLPHTLLSDFRESVLWIGASAALQLLALVPLGIFTGHQQNASYVSAQVVSRALTLGVVWWLASARASLTTLSIAYSATGFLLVPLVYIVLARAHNGYLRALLKLPDLERIKELFSYCSSFSIWTIGALLVNSFDTILIGRIEMPSVNPYALALTLVTVLSGLMHALVSPLLPGVSALYSSSEGRAQCASLLNRATFWCTTASTAIFLGFLLLGSWFLQIYAAQYATATLPFLTILLIAFVIRHITLPYSIFLLSTSLHGKALVSVLVEGLTNLGFSIFLGFRFGAIGIAYGTLIGTIAGQIAIFMSTFPQTRALVPSTSAFLYNGLVRPLFWLTPAFALFTLLLGRTRVFANL